MRGGGRGIGAAVDKLTPHLKSQQLPPAGAPNFGEQTRLLSSLDTPFRPRTECPVTQARSFCKSHGCLSLGNGESDCINP